MAARRRSPGGFDDIQTLYSAKQRSQLREFGERRTVRMTRKKEPSVTGDLGSLFMQGVRENPVATVAIAGVLFFAGGWIAASRPAR